MTSKAAKSPHRLVCHRSKCGKTFESKFSTTRFCSHDCAWRHRAQLRAVAAVPGRKATAKQQAAQRAQSERCPRCSAALGADGPLLFCRSRCGWSDLLTQHGRMP